MTDQPTPQRQGVSITVCYAKCVECQFGEHPKPHAPHGWADIDDIEHAAATGQPEPTGNCGCWCAKPSSGQDGTAA